MDDPLIADLVDDDNPLLSSLVNGGSKRAVVKRNPRAGPHTEGKRVNASAEPLKSAAVGPPPPLPNLKPHRPLVDSVPESARSAMSSSVASSAMHDASLDLLNAFTTLKQRSGWNSGATSAADIEKMDRSKLVTFAKQLYSMIETFSIKSEDDDALPLSASMIRNESRSGSSDPPPGLESNPIGGSMVFRRRTPQNRPASAGSGESLASVLREPVVERGKLQKSKNDDGEKTINEYSIIAELGRGAFGKVKLALNDVTGHTVAIKIMKRSLLKGHESVVAREVAIMKKLRHRNIVSLYEVINDPEAEKIYLVMQYVECGPLYVLNKKDFTCTPLTEDRVLRVLRQLISGLRYLHKRNIVHRDIKPDNILLGSDGTPYLADFGVSEIAKTGSVHNLEGTPMFLAPELFRSQQHVDGRAADVWALGITIYGALYGRLPFVGRSHEAVAKAVQNHPLLCPPDNALTSRWRDVLSGLLEKDPTKRMTLKELKEHPIFRHLDKPATNSGSGDAVQEVEVTDLELLESIRVVQGFAHKEKVNTRFQISLRAKMLIHRYVTNLKRRVQGRHLAKQTPASGSAFAVIRAMSPRTNSISPSGGAFLPNMSSNMSPQVSSPSRPKENTSTVPTATPRLPTLRRTVRKP